MVVYTAKLVGITPIGNEALKNSLTAKVHKVIAAGLKKSGISNVNKEISPEPYTIEWKFDLRGLSAMAFAGKGGFTWWKEKMDDKLAGFDQAEEVRRDTDYTIEWREE